MARQSYRSPSTIDVALLHQLYKNGQLELAPEFQRNGVWPSAAKAYLIDTILNERPMPIFFLQKKVNPQSGRTSYIIIDGQQRLRAIFEFMEDKFRLTQSQKNKTFYKKKFSELSNKDREAIRIYKLNTEELYGYHEKDIRDTFVRINKFVVKLSPQELRHAKSAGEFHKFVKSIGDWDYWKEAKIFSANQIRRMRSIEYAAELVILLEEGPQDKKSSIDVYYAKYADSVSFRHTTEKRLLAYLDWIKKALPEISKTGFKSPVAFYSLVGALESITQDRNLNKLPAAKATKALMVFDKSIKNTNLSGNEARYFAAASRQTDNLIPRQTRIEIITGVLKSVYSLS